MGLGLISDAFAFATTNKETGNRPPAAAAAALALAAGCGKETDLYVWKELAGHLKHYLGVFGDADACGDKLKEFVAAIITPTAERLGWSKVEGEPEIDTLLRTVALSLLAATNHPPTAAEAIRQFEAGTFASDLRPVVLRLVVREGERKHWEAVKEIYLNSAHPEERQNALSAMAASKDPAIQLETFQFALSPAVRGQDINFVLRSTGSSAEVAWSFFTSHIEEMKERFGEGQSFILSGVVKGVAAGFKTAADATMVAEFFAKHAESLPSAKRAISQSVEAITGKAAFYADNLDDVVAFLGSKAAADAIAGPAPAPAVLTPDPNVATTRLAVEGMSCGSCVGAIEACLKPVPGIQSVSVSVHNGTAEISHDFKVVTAQRVAALVGDCGFGATVIEAQEDAAAVEEAD